MKARVQVQISPLFVKKLREIQGKFLLKGIKKSLRQITEDIAKEGNMEYVENEINVLKIRMDKRRSFF